MICNSLWSTLSEIVRYPGFFLVYDQLLLYIVECIIFPVSHPLLYYTSILYHTGDEYFPKYEKMNGHHVA